ncbi:MAG: hypothetical protein WCF84_15080, partial [Anaerolineae bacterium]
MMDCELEHYFGSLADQVPTVADGYDNFVFSTQTLLIPPSQLITDRMIIHKFKQGKDSVSRVDALWFQAHKRTYRELALLILSVVFQPELSRVQVELIHPASDIKHLIVEFEY